MRNRLEAECRYAISEVQRELSGRGLRLDMAELVVAPSLHHASNRSRLCECPSSSHCVGAPVAPAIVSRPKPIAGYCYDEEKQRYFKVGSEGASVRGRSSSRSVLSTSPPIPAFARFGAASCCQQHPPVFCVQNAAYTAQHSRQTRRRERHPPPEQARAMRRSRIARA